VYLVDDDENVLKALKRLFLAEGYSVEGYTSAEVFLSHHDPNVPGCAVIDLALPGLDGFGIQRKLTSEVSNRPVVFLTGQGDIPASVRAMKAGAVDFLTKPPDASVLISAVALAIQRDTQMRQERAKQFVLERRLASLTPREREVLDGVIAGLLNKQIAAQLGTVEKTIKVHRGRMMTKMGVRTVADLIRLVENQRD
jgi:FixJ family two-component response regulator